MFEGSRILKISNSLQTHWLALDWAIIDACVCVFSFLLLAMSVCVCGMCGLESRVKF